MIQGVQVKTLKVLADERGWLMEMLRNDDDMFQGFGQVYMTAAYPGVVKGWHYHKLQVDHFVCVKGMMKVVLFDPREDSPTKGEVNEFHIGERNQQLILEGRPRSPRLRNRGLPWDAETVCLTAMERDRARRYPSARSLEQDLSNVLRPGVQPLPAK